MQKRVSSVVSVLRVLLLRFLGMALSLASSLGIAFFFGASVVSDAFFLVRRLSGTWTTLFDSFTSLIFVPELVAVNQKSGLRTVLDRTQRLELWFVGVGFVMALALWVFPDAIIAALAPGLTPETQSLARLYLILFAITLPLTLMTSLTSAVLSSLRLFSLPVFARLVPRILIVLALLAVPLGFGMTGVVVAAVIGHFVMAFVFFVARRKLYGSDIIDMVPVPTEANTLMSPSGVTGRVWATTIISFYYVAVTLTESYFASFVGVGAIAILTLGQRISNVGISEILRSILAVYYTNFAEYVGDAKPDRMIASVREAIRISLFFVMPFAVVLAALSQPIAQLALANGNFSLDSAILAGQIIVLFSISSVVNVPNSTLETALLSASDHKVVRHFLVASGTSFALRLAVCIVLTPVVGLLAIGYAAVIGPLVLLVFNARHLNKTICPVLDAAIVKSVLVISGASVTAGGVAAALMYSVGWTGHIIVSLLVLGASLGLAIVTFVGICGVFQVPEAQKLVRKLRRK